MLLAAVLVVMVALTVLSMHSLHLHAGTASPQGSRASEASTAGDPAHATEHHATEHHAAGHDSARHHGAVAAVAGADVGMQGHDGGAAGDAGCATCPAGHLGLAITCLVALLLVLALVVRPGAWVLSAGHGGRAGPAPGLVHRILSRPPSLTVLCISRT